MRFTRLSLRLRLTLVVALVCALAVLGVATGLYFAVQRFLGEAQFARLSAAAGVVERRLEGVLASGYLDLGEFRGANFPVDVSLRITGEGQVLASSGGFPAGLPLELPPGNYRLGNRLVLVRAALSDRGPISISLVTTTRGVDEPREAFVRALTRLLPLALLLVAVMAYAIAGRLLRPVRLLEASARRIAESGDLAQPLPGAGTGDELARLALALQDAFSQVARTRAREQEFVRAAAHDLRGPLAATRARVGVALSRERDAARYRQDLAEVDADLARLSKLAGHLLSLARQPQTLERVPLSLTGLVATSVDRAREAALDTWIDLEARGDPWVRGDQVLLGQALENLLQNALRHAPGARVQVRLGAVDGEASIEVRDHGPGVTQEVLSRLGEAFYRPDTARSGEGHGLGLAIVRHAAALHGGRLDLSSAPGEGFTATLVLPLATPATDTPSTDAPRTGAAD